MSADFGSNMPIGFDLTWILAGLLLIPYLLWGEYTLRHRLQDGAEFRPVTEIITLALVGVFFVFQYALLREWLGKTPLYLFLALMGLALSGLILYGHMVVSLVSALLVDLVAPSADRLHEPNYLPGEACEANGDFEGAVREYLAVARIFPKDPKTAIRLGDNLAKLSKWEEAASWFEQGIENLDRGEQVLPIMFRLAEIYAGRLGRGAAAKALYEEFIRRFPDDPSVAIVQARIRTVTDGCSNDLQ